MNTRADLEAAEVQLKYGKKSGSAFQISVFHCHQAVEKISKAFLLERKGDAPRIHDITRLRVLTGLHIPDDIVEAIDTLQPHYLIPRYPDMPFDPSFSFTYNKENTTHILNLTKKVFVWINNQLEPKK